MAVTMSTTGRTLARVFRAAGIDDLLQRFADALGVSLHVEDLQGVQLASAVSSSPARYRCLETRCALRIGAEDVGSLMVGIVDNRPWTHGNLEAVAGLVVDVVGQSLEREIETRHLTAELLSRYEEVNLLYDLSETLAAVFDVPTLCDIAIERAIGAVGAARATVVSADPRTSRLTLVSALGYGPAGPMELTSDSVSGHVATSGLQVLLHPGQQWKGDRGDGDGEALLCVPLLPPGDDPGGRRPLGVLTLVGKTVGERFSAGDARLATTIATQLAVAIQNSRLVDSERESERARQEVEIAAGIQRGLLPAQPLELPGVEVAGLCVPAESVGGDYFDTLVGESGRLTLVIADVAGHSVSSALMMAMARVILRREIREGHGPGAVLQATNEAMLDDLVQAGLFITAFCAQYDTTSGQLRYANAAHNLPLVCRRVDHALVELDADGMPIGIIEGVTFEERTMQLAPGDVVLLYTDGVVEARDATGEQFGDDRLGHSLVAGASWKPRRLAEGIFSAVCRHLDGGVQSDDVTLLALRVPPA